jgi:hypothetical protein
LGHALWVYAGAPKQLGDTLGIDRARLALSRRDLAGHFAGQLADLAFELPNAGLSRVLLNYRQQRMVCRLQLTLVQAVFFFLAWEQIPLGDLKFLSLGIASELDTLHAIEQRCGNAIDVVGRRNEEYL